MDELKLLKSMWTMEDFDLMTWHDCPIYAVAFPPSGSNELWFDIDYVFEWVKPVAPDRHFKNWIAPATLVFENVRCVKFDFEHYSVMEMDEICRRTPHLRPCPDFVGPNTEWSWHIVCHDGSITLEATGFTQYIRSKPILYEFGQLGRNRKNPYSFAGDVWDMEG